MVVHYTQHTVVHSTQYAFVHYTQYAFVHLCNVLEVHDVQVRWRRRDHKMPDGQDTIQGTSIHFRRVTRSANIKFQMSRAQLIHRKVLTFKNLNRIIF